MYQYQPHDQRLVEERAKQFRGQVERRIEGSVREDEFKPLRLQNGLYMQLHAYMLRVAVPYGLLSTEQVRRLAHIAREYDRGYGHFTTRQNIQFNWPHLDDVPKILDELAEVQMHAIQTSGNCIRNVTADHLAGVAKDEIEDPRPYCELIRQWSTFHPEFAFLPRKFKIAVTGAPGDDRAAIRFHDIGIRIVDNDAGQRGFEVWVGGGLGRTPHIAQVCSEFVDYPDLLSYLEAILRVYNRYGRRDNKYKARIKILVNALGIDDFRDKVDAEWAEIKDSVLKLERSKIDEIVTMFAPPQYETLRDENLPALTLGRNRELAHFVRNNLMAHKVPGYIAVMVSHQAQGAAARGRQRHPARRPRRRRAGVLPRAARGHPRAERGAPQRASARPTCPARQAGRVGPRHAQRRAHHRLDLLPRAGLLQPGQRAIDPGGSRDRRALRRDRLPRRRR